MPATVSIYLTKKKTEANTSFIRNKTRLHMKRLRTQEIVGKQNQTLHVERKEKNQALQK